MPIDGDTIMFVGLNLISNVVTEICLTIKARSPLAPLKKGGTGSDRSRVHLSFAFVVL